MYMLESHGISEPPAGSSSIPEKKRRLIPIFPDVSLYLLELAALFGSAMLLISVIFPLDLPPEYSPQLAAQYTAQPDWYFLWIYQILKISVFEGAGLPVALSIVTLIFIVLFLLPFIDRGETRTISKRMKFVTLGAIFVTEIAVLSVWGLVTPGRIIPDEQAALVLGGTALLIAAISVVIYRLFFRRWASGIASSGKVSTPASARSASMWAAGSFVLLLAVGTFAIGSTINALMEMIVRGPAVTSLPSLLLPLTELSLAVVGTMYVLHRLDLGSESIKQRIAALR
jgi:quinol-cytochrome oxidoreductase complex cytochrome b subunit